MNIIKKGLWDYFEKWRKISDNLAPPKWENNRVENEFCGQCRFCCGLQDSEIPFPMALLDRQIDEKTPENFYLLDKNTACLDRRGCKAAGSNGCRLPVEKRPIACGFFPIVLVNGRLYLYLQCPSVLFTPLWVFLELGKEVALQLESLTLPELQHVSLNLTDKVLAQNYIDLHIEIFSNESKETIFL